MLLLTQQSCEPHTSEYYNYPEGELSVENLALARNWITSNGRPDTERTSVYILRDFREGKIGKFILDEYTV